MEQSSIYDYLSRAAPKDKFYTEDEKSRAGTKKFKRRLMGRFRFQCTKTLEEVAQALQETGAVSSIDKGRELVPQLLGKRMDYGNDRFLEVMEVNDGEGNNKYRVKVCTYDY